jgi:hypothetical protein
MDTKVCLLSGIGFKTKGNKKQNTSRTFGAKWPKTHEKMLTMSSNKGNAN